MAIACCGCAGSVRAFFAFAPPPSGFPSLLACACFRFALMAHPGQNAAEAAAAAVAAAGGDPQMAALLQARTNLQLLKDQQKRVAKDVKNEERKRARNLERARGLSSGDLLSLFTDKVYAEAKAKAKAKAKGKAKAKAKAAAAAAAPAAAAAAAAAADGNGAASRSSLQKLTFRELSTEWRLSSWCPQGLLYSL